MASSFSYLVYHKNSAFSSNSPPQHRMDLKQTCKKTMEQSCKKERRLWINKRVVFYFFPSKGVALRSIWD